MLHPCPNLLLSKAHAPVATTAVAIIACHLAMPDLQLPNMVHAPAATTAVTIIV